MKYNGILTEEERTDLIVRVADDTMASPFRLKALLPREHYIHIPTDADPATYGYNIVSYCERYAWVMKPGLLIKLLDRWKAEQSIADLIVKLQGMQPPQYHPQNKPWATCLVHVEIPFLSRSITREAIERFQYDLKEGGNPAGVRVLVVNGPSRSGKSHTQEFIRYVNAMYGKDQYRIVVVDRKTLPLSFLGPAELIGVLLDQMDEGWRARDKLPELSDEQASRWVQTLCEVVAKKLTSGEQGEKTWLFVLDGFDGGQVSPLVVECIQYLAKLATGQEKADIVADRMRLVLLGFKQGVPDYSQRVRTEDIKEPDANDIELCFKCYADYKKRPLTPDELSTLVTAAQNEEFDLQEEGETTTAVENGSGPFSRIPVIARRIGTIAKMSF